MGKGTGKGTGHGGGRGGKKSAVEREQAADEERKEREASRAAKRANKLKNVEGIDALEIAQREMGGAAGHESMAEQAAQEEEEADAEMMLQMRSKKKGGGGGGEDADAEATAEKEMGKLGLCIEWCLEKPKAPLDEWQTYRSNEMQDFIKEKRRGLLYYMPKFYDTLLISYITRKRMYYWGEYDNKGERDGRGVCLWPDPPFGGGGDKPCTLDHSATSFLCNMCLIYSISSATPPVFDSNVHELCVYTYIPRPSLRVFATPFF